MEKEPMPEIVLFPCLEKLKRMAHFVFDQFRHEGISDHRGAENMLSEMMIERSE